MNHPDPDVSLRPAIPADAPCIGMLGIQVFLDTYAPDGVRPELAREAMQNFSAAAIEEQMASASISFIVAERSGHLVGFAQLTHGTDHVLVPYERAAELNRLYVQKRFMSKGIGKALLQRAEALAASRGAEALWLTAWVENPRALAYYPKQGYSDVGATTYIFEDDHYENRLFVKELVNRVG